MPKSSFNCFWILEKRKFEKNEIDLESACSEDSASLLEIKIEGLQAKICDKRKNSPLPLCFEYFVGLVKVTDAHMDTRIVFIFLGRLLRDVSYDIWLWDERHKKGSERKG